MLYQILQMIQSGAVKSQLDIARQMKISPEMALDIARELARRGYLMESGECCDSSQPACSGCPTKSACQTMVKLWSLTEKGKKAVLKDPPTHP